MTQTVAQWIDSHGSAVEFQDVIAQHGQLKIVEEFSHLLGNARPFPQKRFTHRNVHNWVLLEDGSAMGWNESPRSGWSYPRIGAGTVKQMHR